MSREELELMWQLKRVLGQVGEFVLDFSGGDMEPDRVLTFSKELTDLAAGLRSQAVGRLSVVSGDVVAIDGEAMPLVVEAGSRSAAQERESLGVVAHSPVVPLAQQRVARPSCSV